MAGKIPLLLLPGLLCDAGLWRAQASGLADVAAVTIADLTHDDTMTGMARGALAQAPAGPFALAGLSMGGYCALEIMRQAGSRVERLALLDTSARGEKPEQSSRRRGLIELAEKGEFKGVTPRLLPLFLHPDRLKDAVLVAEVTAMAARVGKDAFIRQQKAIMSRVDSLATLPNIRCPTLVLCGRQDALTPLSLSEEIAAGIPGARLDVVENCGHLSTMERPEAVTAEMIQWLTA